MSHVTETSARVQAALEDLSGFSQVNETTFVARRGSAVVAIRVEDAGEEALVHVEANVVEGASLSPAVYHQLLEFNHGSAWGAFGVDEEGTVTVHHSLGGATIARDTLVPVVVEVARIADDWDDVIVDQAGGKTAIERLSEMRKPKAQPTIVPAPQDAPSAASDASADSASES